MDDLISRRKALNTVRDMFDKCDGDIETYRDLMVKSLEYLIAEQPKMGHWEMLSKQSARCTACGNIQFTHGIDETMSGCIFNALYRYCPNCGAYMRGDKSEDD